MKKGELQRAKIIDIAIGQIAEKGIAATSFQKIADTLGISQSGVFHYFKNKTELFLGVLESILERRTELINQLITPTDDSIGRIRKHCQASLTWLIDKPSEAKIILYLYQQSSTNSVVLPFGEKVILNGRNRLEDLIVEGQAEGSISPKVDAKLWGRLLHEFLTGSLMQTICLYENCLLPKEVQEFDIRLNELLDCLKA
ncbi:TetR/AcrR family transcriptional regulator [Halobacteriovorax vibrionivorans]|uniref:TetR/AcrR family transcriptional regulator n=1 Tax=Halobacteriovorax vibrionivorans TaxID=2152716 RepID=A0ABY0IHL1_9BACT|nr:MULTISPECIES: TetR/AcrR family transcriptional regulator [Halobacteriovorax]RZF21039.1 TetR/AcrR family transcriptional regulator [Halobacteriovorax vibrionivorans]TGD48053.1 TetR/AcrR family transcriptional regulator [Halobacteriovorax sp. Y22]